MPVREGGRYIVGEDGQHIREDGGAPEAPPPALPAQPEPLPLAQLIPPVTDDPQTNEDAAAAGRPSKPKKV